MTAWDAFAVYGAWCAVTLPAAAMFLYLAGRRDRPRASRVREAHVQRPDGQVVALRSRSRQRLTVAGDEPRDAA